MFDWTGQSSSIRPGACSHGAVSAVSRAWLTVTLRAFKTQVSRPGTNLFCRYQLWQRLILLSIRAHFHHSVCPVLNHPCSLCGPVLLFFPYLFFSVSYLLRRRCRPPHLKPWKWAAGAPTVTMSYSASGTRERGFKARVTSFIPSE